MAYTPGTWVEGSTVIHKTDMDRIELGVQVTDAAITEVAPGAAGSRLVPANKVADLSATYARALVSQRTAALIRGEALGSEAMWYNNTWTGSVNTANSRKQYTAQAGTGATRVVYANAYSQSESLSTTVLTVRAAIELAGSVFIPLFFNGVRDVTIQPGAVVVSDPAGAYIAKGTQFWIRTFMQSSVPTATPFMGGELVTVTAQGEGCDAAYNVTTTDLTTSGTIAAGAVAHYSPIAVITGATNQPFVGAVGDSIASGIGDSSFPTTGRGFIRRAINNTLPLINLASGGENLTLSRRIRRMILAGCSSIICNLGINDLTNGSTVATIEQGMVTEWTALNVYGAKVFHTTLTPHTTSTDNWATTTNQTPVASEANRVAVNTWIRAGAPIDPTTKAPVAVGTTGALLFGSVGHPAAGYFETADTVETARNSGLWKVGYVYLTDSAGLHPNNTGAAAMAAAVTIASLT